MIYVDANVPMYLVGTSPTLKDAAERVLTEAVAAEERLITSAEVLQEILHRYVAINRRQAIAPAFDALLGVVDEVVPIGEEDVQRARDLVISTKTLSARDALHVAVMLGQGVNRIMSFDADFDRVPGIVRIA